MERPQSVCVALQPNNPERDTMVGAPVDLLIAPTGSVPGAAWTGGGFHLPVSASDLGA